MRLVTRLLILIAIALLAGVAHADPIAPGYDLLETLPGTYHDFTGPLVIPAGFFGPGSEPFTGRVDFTGLPMAPQPGCLGPLGNTDVLVHRPLAASPPCCPGQETVPIEIVALSLTSVNPIIVTYSGGGTEHWRVDWTSGPSTAPPGQMTVRHIAPAGGTFDSQLPVRPIFTFTRVEPPARPPVLFDLGPSSFFDVFVSVDVPWSHGGPPSLLVSPCPGNFFPGIQGGTIEAPMEAFSFNFGHMVLRYTHQSTPTRGRSSTWGLLKTAYR